MFDGLRKDASDTSGFDEPAGFFPEDDPAAPVRRRRKSGEFLGMTAPQRFILAVMLMVTVCIVGTLIMEVSQRFAF